MRLPGRLRDQERGGIVSGYHRQSGDDGVMMNPVDIQPTDKTHRAVQDVAARYGVAITAPVAKAIAEAVLECADDEYRASCEVMPELWGRSDVMAELKRRLRLQVGFGLLEAEVLPTALPREVIIRPAHPWEPLKVEWVVPTRKPPTR